MENLLHQFYKRKGNDPENTKVITTKEHIFFVKDIKFNSCAYSLLIEHNHPVTHIDFTGVEEDVAIVFFIGQAIAVKIYTSGYKGSFGFLIEQKNILFIPITELKHEPKPEPEPEPKPEPEYEPRSKPLYAPQMVIIAMKGDIEIIRDSMSRFSEKSDQSLVDAYNRDFRLGFVVKKQALYLVALHKVFLKRFNKSPLKFKDNCIELTHPIKLTDTSWEYIDAI